MILALLLSLASTEALTAGVAKIDITPELPIRLSGYGGRREEAAQIAQHLFARALAVGSPSGEPALLITVDACGIPRSLTDQVARRLASERGLQRERFTLAVTHSHTAPCVADYLPTLFGEDIPPDHRAHIEHYTRTLIERLVSVGSDALASMRPAHLAMARGTASFAINRRTRGDPVDHSLPLLAVRGGDDRLLATLVSYACHCTTLGGEHNAVCGDWAGCAAEHMEQDAPGSIALVAIGCGGDANPAPRTGFAFAEQHGRAIATEAKRLLASEMTAIRSPPECRLATIELPFAPLPTEPEWQRRASQPGAIGYHARRELERLAHGEALPETLPYTVQTWTFGDQLAMVFLAGEVVVDYARRLQWEFDAARLWVTAYANDVPCYIPSRRILAEGGYEAQDAMVYYDRPTKLSALVEDRIVTEVRDQLPRAFASSEARREQPDPLPAPESLASIRTRADLRVELVASEPLIDSPVAIDWSLDRKLYVCEMCDYPTGMDLNGKPGGRIKVLRDGDGDGRYDQATVFLEGLPFPTGVTAWRRGVLVCAAPDILYAEDRDGDDRADVRQVLFTGFATENFQARVNSLTLGLDHWIYGATGLLSANVQARGGATIALSNRDFRMRPDSLAIEPAAGLSQQGRVRDDWGNWFGCDNGTPIWQFPLPEHYLARSPHFAAPDPRVAIAADEDPAQLYPVSRALSRFNDPTHLGRITSACGLEIYRDDWLGAEFRDNAFVCEPVHNLVHRLRLEPRGVTFAALKPDDERSSEFLASTDNWFRPVQARAGPDGALYIVDMYRLLIEHPRWVPDATLAHIDVRAGAGMGRIYRVLPANRSPRPVIAAQALATEDLAAALDHQSGTWRDRIHAELLHRNDRAASQTLARLAAESDHPACRVQASSILAGLGALTPDMVHRALGDANAQVRSNALRLAEPWLDRDADLLARCLALARDPNAAVRFQLALSLGAASDPRAHAVLGQLAQRELDDDWMRAAVLSSASHCASEVLARVLTTQGASAALGVWAADLVGIAAATETDAGLATMFDTLLPHIDDAAVPGWRLRALNGWFDAIDRRGVDATTLTAAHATADAPRRLALALSHARRVAIDADADADARIAAIALLAHDAELLARDLPDLERLLSAEQPLVIQTTALQTLASHRELQVADLLIKSFRTFAPTVRALVQDALLSRTDWAARLLDAIAAAALEAGDLDAAHRQRLLSHADATLRERASTLLTAAGSDRSQVLAQLQLAITEPGDAMRGAETFDQLCASCHELRGRGHAVGPDLRALSDKTREALLLAILNPNGAVDNRYVAYVVETRDGRSLTGIVTAEAANSITLVQGGGLTTTLLRGDISAMTTAARSLMPDGLEQGTTPAQFADLIAFLQSSPRPLGASSPDAERAARAQFLAAGTNGFARVLGYQDVFQQPSWLGRVPMYYCRQMDGHGKVTWDTAPVPATLDPQVRRRFRLAAATGFVSQPEGKFTLFVNGKECLDFNVAVNDATWQSTDQLVRMTYQVLQNNSEDSTGVLEIEVAPALLTAGQPVVFEVIGSAAASQRWFGVLDVPR